MPLFQLKNPLLKENQIGEPYVGDMADTRKREEDLL